MAVSTVGQVDPTAVYESPELLVGGVLLLVLLVFLVLFFRRQRELTPGEKFARLVGREDEIAVLMHSNPDPDAMSCAIAVQAIADASDTAVTLYYPGQIRHHENRAFETVLDVDFERIETADEIAEKAVVLVDHNQPRGFDGTENVDPIAVVDHHPGDGEGAEFTDMRPEHGACATIFSEYFEDLGWVPVSPGEFDSTDRADVLPPRVATALIYGIQSDTKHLTSGCSPAEFDATSYLYDGLDQDKLTRIANPDMDAESLEVKARAITERTVRGPFAISDVGTVSNVDAIAQAADELKRLEGVSAVVVLGDKDDTIQLSGRSSDDRVHMGRALETAIEPVPLAGAGGHARMGGGQVPIINMDAVGKDKGLTREELKERLFDAMSGEL